VGENTAGITCSMGQAGNVWGNSAMENFFSTLKIEQKARKVYRIAPTCLTTSSASAIRHDTISNEALSAPWRFEPTDSVIAHVLPL
jgi:transposase InsO family protein